MPNSIKRKVKAMGRNDKQDGPLKFANRQNVEFDWSLRGGQPLVKDNAEEHKALYPDISTEVPRIVMEEDVVAPFTDIGPPQQRMTKSMEDRASLAARNANFGP